jgi:hypothetical protein
MEKRINVRIEHVQHSKCRLDFLKRVKKNEVLKREAKEKGIKVVTKREVTISPPNSIYFLNSLFLFLAITTKNCSFC